MQGFINVTAAAGRVIEAMIVSDDPPSGRDVILKFTDGTELVVNIQVETVATAKHYRPNGGDLDVLKEYRVMD
jgi:hypothetical protein